MGADNIFYYEYLEEDMILNYNAETAQKIFNDIEDILAKNSSYSVVSMSLFVFSLLLNKTSFINLSGDFPRLTLKESLVRIKLPELESRYSIQDPHIGENK